LWQSARCQTLLLIVFSKQQKPVKLAVRSFSMAEQKVDRRVKYTKMVIKNSFIALAGQKAISKITIKEICQDADINRATFYAHYTDQYDLLRQIENDFLEDINRHLEATSNNCTEGESVKMLTRIIEYVKENAEVCAVLISDKGDLRFQQQIMMITQKQLVFELKPANKLSKEDAEYLYIFVAVGSVGIIQKWLADGMKKPAEELAEMIITITKKGFSAL
jgi:AcrR family transcriptional regulator